MNVIFSIAKTTIGEAIRRRVLLIILLIGVLLLMVLPGINLLTPRSEMSVLQNVTLGLVQLTSAVIAIVLTVYIVPTEIERRTIYTILSKPVLRWQFLLGKYFGAIGALGLMMLLMTITMLVVFMVTGRLAGAEQAAVLIRTPFMYFIQMCLLAAVAMFFSTFVTPVVNIFLSGGTYLIGSLMNSLFSTIAEGQDVNPLVRAGATVLHTIVPNFQSFTTDTGVANAGQEIRDPTLYYVELGTYAIVYIVILLLGAILVFDRREV